MFLTELLAKTASSLSTIIEVGECVKMFQYVLDVDVIRCDRGCFVTRHFDLYVDSICGRSLLPLDMSIQCYLETDSTLFLRFIITSLIHKPYFLDGKEQMYLQ
jgi:hypothetical protein